MYARFTKALGETSRRAGHLSIGVSARAIPVVENQEGSGNVGEVAEEIDQGVAYRKDRPPGLSTGAAI
jgi:hypothetical protein